MYSEQIEHADGRVELRPEVDLGGTALANDDLAPTRLAGRTWTTYSYAALWISMAHCIPTYSYAAGLINLGMSWAQALVTILLGNLIVLGPILLNSHAGTRYGIPFPVFARASYGIYGSNLPALMRALVGCGWFGINAWIGGQALHTLFLKLWPGWETCLGAATGGHVVGTQVVGAHAPTEWIAFALFWLLNMAVVFRGMDLLRRVENWAAPFVLVMTLALVVWAVRAAHGLGDIMAQPGRLRTFGSFFPVFVPALTAMIGFWATLSLNMPDFTRFGRSQREQVVGQVVALPTTMTVFAAMGIVITSATKVIYGVAIWDPMALARHFQSPVVVAVAMFTVVVATLAVNIAANVVSPANDFANAFPGRIKFRTGGLLTGLIGVAMMPWKLLEDADRYINGWLLGYSGGLGSIAGVLIVDYWLVRGTRLDVAELYRPRGVYAYTRVGVNPVAVIATLAGCFLAWGKFVIPAMAPLWNYAWFVGGGGSAAVYLLGTRVFGSRGRAAAPAALSPRRPR